MIHRLLALAAGGLAAGLLGAAPAGAACPRDERCLRVIVPLDRAAVAPGTLALRVRVLPAARRPAARGVLVALAGGPGQAAVPLARELRASLGPAARDFDVVVLDQRGTGGSGRLACPLAGEGYRKTARAVAACGAALGPRAGAYTTRDSAEDVEAVRVALGADRLTLFGVSYGTKVAQAYAALHPERTNALVLDSVLGLDGPDPYAVATFARLPAALRDACARRACRLATRSPVADVRHVAARLERRAVAGRVIDGRGRGRRIRLTAVDLLDLLVEADLDPFLASKLPGAIRSAALGDLAPLLRAQAETPLEDLDERSGDSGSLYYATVCEETRFPWARKASAPARRAAAGAAFRARARSFSPFGWRTALAVSDVGACSGWPARPDPPVIPTGLPDVPTLLLAGAQDLRTPVANARRLARRLPRSRLVVVSGVGHSVAGVECGTRAISVFLRGGRSPGCARFDALPARPRLPRRLAAVRALGARGAPGRVAAAAVLTLGDAAYGDLVGFFTAGAGDGADAPERPSAGGGVRGGAWASRSGCLSLRRMQDVAGVRVSSTDCGRRLVVDGPGRLDGVVRLAGLRRVHGAIGGRAVTGRPGTVDPLLAPVRAVVRATATRRAALLPARFRLRR